MPWVVYSPHTDCRALAKVKPQEAQRFNLETVFASLKYVKSMNLFFKRESACVTKLIFNKLGGHIN